MNKVCVLGSINMDLVVKVNEIPRIGETILSKSFEKIAGGKGANQAIAARRCGAEVSMIAKMCIRDRFSIQTKRNKKKRIK